ncbi:hypothetical protein, partial [Corynebacterium sp. UMB10321]|uniref:hypothetical protein n=1 Tax=Corynebacterium sp. UMB10321 TaxID=3046312 RepID=UPI00254A40FA
MLEHIPRDSELELLLESGLALVVGVGLADVVGLTNVLGDGTAFVELFTVVVGSGFTVVGSGFTVALGFTLGSGFAVVLGSDFVDVVGLTNVLGDGT